MNTNPTDQNSQIYYRRNLPHFQPYHAVYFVTFRLKDSLPVPVIKRLKQEKEEEENTINKIANESKRMEKRRDFKKLHFKKYDSLLDKISTGPRWLRKPEIANIVSQAMHYRDGKVYNLVTFCIMPNHVHMVFDVKGFTESSLVESVTRPLLRSPGSKEEFEEMSKKRVSDSPYIVTNILHSLKIFTARKANRLLNRTGIFWQHESFDHVVRKGKELERIIWYVLNNPVIGGLVGSWQDWPYSYSKFNLDIMQK